MCNCVSTPLKFSKQQEDTDLAVIASLLSSFETSFQRDFLQLIQRINANLPLSDISDLIQLGQTQQAIDLVETSLLSFADIVVTAVTSSSSRIAEHLSQALNVIVSFDQTNSFAVNALRNTRLNLITSLNNAQREAIRESLVDGIRRGINPLEQARNLRQSIGLTARQVSAVNNFRTLLQSGSAQALNRRLRDRRFDSSVRRQIRGEALTDAQIERMVERYAQRQLVFRGRVIARTEALRAVHEGSDLMYQQAVSTGTLDGSRLLRTWRTAGDSSVRESHDGMEGQQRGFGQPFLTDAGNELRYPGDSQAPGQETIECRCLVTTRLLPIGQVFGAQ